ncbi:unnamed protein product [Effrenium voratum]|nr:unnamed protein product [Effrenium voratum]
MQSAIVWPQPAAKKGVPQRGYCVPRVARVARVTGKLQPSSETQLITAVATGLLLRSRRSCFRTQRFASQDLFSAAALHQPLGDPSDVQEWLPRAFEAANGTFFHGKLQVESIRVDPSWHLRGGAGGTHTASKCIVLDPSVHGSYRDLCGTLFHEMLHLQIKDADECEHGPIFLRSCLDLNEAIRSTGLACFCRLGEFDTALDRKLFEEAGLPAFLCDGLASSGSHSWDAGLLAGDLREASGNADADGSKQALQVGFPSWAMRSRTMSQYCVLESDRASNIEDLQMNTGGWHQHVALSSSGKNRWLTTELWGARCVELLPLRAGMSICWILAVSMCGFSPVAILVPVRTL